MLTLPEYISLWGEGIYIENCPLASTQTLTEAPRAPIQSSGCFNVAKECLLTLK